MAPPAPKPGTQEKHLEASPDRSGLWWYGFGAALLGLLVGVTSGLSRTPVAAVLIPLLFALISGGSGFYLAKSDLSSAESRHHLAVLGKVLSLFCLFALAGLVYGALVRTNSSIADLVPRLRFSSPPKQDDIDLSGVSVEGSLELAALKLRLELLGMPPAQVSKILAAAKEEWKEGVSYAELKRVIGDVKGAASHAKDLTSRVDLTTLDETTRTNVLLMRDELSRLEQRYSYWLTAIENQAHLDTYKLNEILTKDRRDFTDLMEDDDVSSWQFASSDLRDSLIALEARLSEPLVQFDKIHWRSDERIISEIDELIKSTGGQAPPAEARTLTTRPGPSIAK